MSKRFQWVCDNEECGIRREAFFSRRPAGYPTDHERKPCPECGEPMGILQHDFLKHVFSIER